jgi:hypothetical protein
LSREDRELTPERRRFAASRNSRCEIVISISSIEVSTGQMGGVLNDGTAVVQAWYHLTFFRVNEP